MMSGNEGLMISGERLGQGSDGLGLGIETRRLFTFGFC